MKFFDVVKELGRSIINYRYIFHSRKVTHFSYDSKVFSLHTSLQFPKSSLKKKLNLLISNRLKRVIFRMLFPISFSISKKKIKNMFFGDNVIFLTIDFL